ncbi:hypothetical protein [Mesorhizobium sp. 1B3]
MSTRITFCLEEKRDVVHMIEVIEPNGLTHMLLAAGLVGTSLQAAASPDG